jgi:hypothetical protein
LVFIDQVAAVNWQLFREASGIPLETGLFAQAGMPALRRAAAALIVTRAW